MNETIDYNAIADTYSAHRRASETVLEHIQELVSDSEQNIASVLEIGCGTANHLGVLAKQLQAEPFGFDQSEEMLKQAMMIDPELTLKTGDANAKFPFEDGMFDLSFSVDVIHHIENLDTFFNETYRVSGKRGTLITVTDSEEDIRQRTLSKYFPESIEKELARYPAVPEIISSMQQSGWKDFQISHTERSFALHQTHLEKYRCKAYSALQLIDEEAFLHGLGALEADIAAGTAEGKELYTYISGRKIDH